MIKDPQSCSMDRDWRCYTGHLVSRCTADQRERHSPRARQVGLTWGRATHRAAMACCPLLRAAAVSLALSIGRPWPKNYGGPRVSVHRNVLKSLRSVLAIQELTLPSLSLRLSNSSLLCWYCLFGGEEWCPIQAAPQLVKQWPQPLHFLGWVVE